MISFVATGSKARELDEGDGLRTTVTAIFCCRTVQKRWRMRSTGLGGSVRLIIDGMAIIAKEEAGQGCAGLAGFTFNSLLHARLRPDLITCRLAVASLQLEL